MKPIDPRFEQADLNVKVGSRYHRLVARLFDTHLDDLSDASIEAVERQIDERRNTHSSGRLF